MPENQDYSAAGVPKGCNSRVKTHAAKVSIPEPEPKTQFLIARSVPRPAPEPARLIPLSELERRAAVQEYQGAFLLDMRQAARNLTAQSTFNDAAIQAWNDAIDQAVSQTARYL